MHDIAYNLYAMYIEPAPQYAAGSIKYVCCVKYTEPTQRYTLHSVTSMSNNVISPDTVNLHEAHCGVT